MSDQPILQGLFGRLPPDPAKRRLLIGAPTWVVEPPLPVVDHLSPVPLSMDGNDRYGNCVVVACKNDFVTTWMALRPGEPVPLVSEADCIRDYQQASGVVNPPGPGLVTERFLDWLLVHGLNSDPRTKPLAWGSPRDDWTSIEQVNSEFVAGIYGVAIHSAQSWPSSLWDTPNEGDLEGYHEVGGGRHDPSYIYCATWAYQARMTRSYVSGELNEHHVIIWPHVWDNLSTERQAHLAADYQALTGRVFPVPPAPLPPEVTVPSNIVLFTTPAPRLCDSRAAQGTGLALAAGETREVPIPDAYDLPANADGLIANVTVVNGKADGWLSVAPTAPDLTKPFSNINWGAGDKPRPNLFTCGFAPSKRSVFVHNGSKGTVDFLIDPQGYTVPA